MKLVERFDHLLKNFDENTGVTVDSGPARLDYRNDFPVTKPPHTGNQPLPTSPFGDRSASASAPAADMDGMDYEEEEVTAEEDEDASDEEASEDEDEMEESFGFSAADLAEMAVDVEDAEEDADEEEDAEEMSSEGDAEEMHVEGPPAGDSGLFHSYAQTPFEFPQSDSISGNVSAAPAGDDMNAMKDMKY